MNLIGREQAIRGHTEDRCHARAILGDLVGSILRADAAIKRSINTLRHAAGTREKCVANAFESGKCGGLEHSASYATTEYIVRARTRSQPIIHFRAARPPTDGRRR